MYARGSVFGITRGTTKAHIIRATLESIAYQTFDVLMAMNKETKIKIKTLQVDGGASVNNFLMQFQSNILQCQVNKPAQTEITSLGAALLAGLYTNFYNMDEIKSHSSTYKSYEPSMPLEKRNQLIERWHRAIEKSKDWLLED